MKLTIKERILFSQLYPQQSNILTQLTVKTIAKKVELNQEEIKGIELKVQPDGSIAWNSEKATDLEVEFTPTELAVLKTQVDELDKKNNVTRDLLDICVKIREEK